MDNLFEALEAAGLMQETGGPACAPSANTVRSGTGPTAVAWSSVADNLRGHVHKLYPLADGRWRYPGPNRPFKVDDRAEGVDRWRWSILATVPAGEVPLIHLAVAGIPYDPAVAAVVGELGGRTTETGAQLTLDLSLRPPGHSEIRKLARAIRQMAAAKPEWCWLIRRTGAALEQLADHLAGFQAYPPNASRS